MKKKKIIIIAAIVIFVLMLIPIKDRLWDGGSTEYKAILYKYTKIHRISQTSSTGYEDGWELKILGVHVAGKINTYVEALPKITIEELEEIHKAVGESLKKYRESNEYTNFASSGVDRENYRLIIELIDNSEKEQQWFRENIYDSKYIVFKQGGPYTTSNVNTIKFNEYLTRDEGRIVYLAGNMNDFYVKDSDSKKVKLKDYAKTWQTIDDIIKHIIEKYDLANELNDGGTKIYKSNEDNATIVVCNTTLGNKDIFIGDYNMQFDNESMCKR